jgi:porin
MRKAWARVVPILVMVLLPLAAPAVAQNEDAPTSDGTVRVRGSLRCPTLANPGGLPMECVGRPFDFGETLSRDWAGFRTELIRLGITPTASYVAQFLGNPSGGQSTGFTYAGTFELLVHWDIGKLLPVGGLSLVVGTGWSTGRSLSADEIGNIFTVQSAYTAVDGGTNSLTLGPLYLHQRLLDDRLMLAVGRLAPAETFATMPVLNNYVNGGISATPGSLETDIPSFATYPPGMQWGAQAVYRLTPALQVEAGVFNASRRSAAGADGGADFSLGGDHTGVLSVVQATYLINRAGTSAGLPGLYSVGGMYDSSRFSRVSGSGGTTQGNTAVYAMFQQMVYREGGPGSDQGLTLWGEVAVAPRSSVSPLPLFVGGGVSYQGLIPGRGPDIASLGVIGGALSHDLPGTTAETVVEMNYQLILPGGLSIMPDLQYIIRPGGVRAVGNALVLGAQVTISF